MFEASKREGDAMSLIIVPMADGFEEIEAVVIIDVLRRADVEVAVAGVGGPVITGSHGIKLICDVRIEECDYSNVDGIALPGGLPGTTNLAESAAVRELILSLNERGKTVAAICAAPTVLGALGLLEGKRATSHPSQASKLEGCVYVEDPVVVDGNIITSRGAGTAIPFAGELVKTLVNKEKALAILEGIVAT